MNITNCTGAFVYNPALDEFLGNKTTILTQLEVQTPWAYVHFTFPGNKI